MFALARFEVIRRLRLISTYLYVALFFGLGLLFVAGGGGAIGGIVIDFGAGSKVAVNSPYSLSAILALAGHFGVMVNASITGRAVCDDLECGAAPILYATPIGERRFIAGRFLGALSVMLLFLPFIAVGAFVGSLLPGMDPARLGPNHLRAYVEPYAQLLLPNLVITAALFFSIALLARRMLPVLATGVMLLLGYLLAAVLAGDVERRTLGALVDPFGLQAVDTVTAYWTVAERNTAYLPFGGLLLANRAIWLSAAGLLLAFASRRFSFSKMGGSAPSRAAPEVAVATPREPEPIAPPLAFDASARTSLLWNLVWLQLRETARSPSFGVLAFAGALFVAVQGTSLDQIYGTPTYPVTYEMLEVVGASFGIFIILFIAIYSGELVHRERDARFSPIYDALPLPRWVTLGAKLLSLFALVALLQLVVMAGGAVLQLAHGFTRIEPGLYLRHLYLVQFPTYAAIAVMAVMVHVLVDNKGLGHVIVAFAFAANLLLLPRAGFEHHLYLFATSPPVVYSDMNGYGPYVEPIALFRSYWALVAIVLAVVAHLFWVEGTERALRKRLAIARERFTRPVAAILVVAIAGAAVIGAFIFHATNRQNRYRTKIELEHEGGDYERTYRKTYLDAPSPRITDAHVEVDLFPSDRRAVLHGTLTLQNKGSTPMDRVFLDVPVDAHIEKLSFGRGERLETNDERLGVRIYALAEPVAPLEPMNLEFALTYHHEGFKNGEADESIAANGTFLGSGHLPHIGYDENRELESDDARKREALVPARKRLRDLDDPSAPAHNYVSSDGDWVHLDSVVSTSSDQLPIGPGKLLRSWQDGGRNYAHFATTPPVLNLYAFLSARYAVLRDSWNGIDIEIDYHPDHTWDLDRMVRGVKASLAYATENYGPYQHEGVRIVEFPRYERLAQSLPAMIPYSEAIGFIARVDDGPEAIDLPLYVTAHEVTHQWWGHQVLGANAQGSTVLSETLAQYSALMVMKRIVGPASMRRFLRYELDRYLRARGQEQHEELPLLRVEEQPYVHYNKGSLVMYRVQSLIGEATVNLALKELVAAERFHGPPYPTSRALYDRLVAKTPEELRPALADLFEKITLYDNHAVTAEAREVEPGVYDVDIAYVAQKAYADEHGTETIAKLDDPIDFGVLDDKGELLATERRRITEPNGKITVRVKGKPAKAGIDPLNELVDRKPEDNVVAVTFAQR